MFLFGEKSKEKDNLAFIAELNSLKIKEQLEKQIVILQKTEILRTLKNGKTLGIFGVDNKEYRMPTLEEILKRLDEKKELVRKKVKQGFTKVLLVPFACPLGEIIEKYQQALLAHYNNRLLFATKEKTEEKDEPLELDSAYPINIWKECKDGDVKNNFAYFPTKYDKDGHQGKTKLELLFIDPKNAWQVLLVEDMPNIPNPENSKKVGHRRQIEAGKTPIEYLEMLQKDKDYRGEDGLTPEAELVYALIYLEETNQVINDWQGKGNISCQIGAFLVPSNGISWLGWNRDFKRADFWKMEVENRDSHIGPRVGISI
jgi:hypothetical protein